MEHLQVDPHFMSAVDSNCGREWDEDTPPPQPSQREMKLFGALSNIWKSLIVSESRNPARDR